MRFIKRLVFVIRASRQGRGDELDRVFDGMAEGASFEGAKGHMLLSLARDKRWVEMNMRMNEHNSLDEDVLGRLWARRLEAYIKATRTESLTFDEVRSR